MIVITVQNPDGSKYMIRRKTTLDEVLKWEGFHGAWWRALFTRTTEATF